jgi:hypothetical protein
MLKWGTYLLEKYKHRFFFWRQSEIAPKLLNGCRNSCFGTFPSHQIAGDEPWELVAGEADLGTLSILIVW